MEDEILAILKKAKESGHEERNDEFEKNLLAKVTKIAQEKTRHN